MKTFVKNLLWLAGGIALGQVIGKLIWLGLVHVGGS